MGSSSFILMNCQRMMSQLIMVKQDSLASLPKAGSCNHIFPRHKEAPHPVSDDEFSISTINLPVMMSTTFSPLDGMLLLFLSWMTLSWKTVSLYCCCYSTKSSLVPLKIDSSYQIVSHLVPHILLYSLLFGNR